jgi:hypothetical protein
VPDLDTPAAIAREVTLLTGVPIAAADVVDVVVQEWRDAVPGAAPDDDVRADAARGIHHTGPPSPVPASPPSSRTPARSPPVWRTSSLTPIPSTPRGVTHDRTTPLGYTLFAVLAGPVRASPP